MEIGRIAVYRGIEGREGFGGGREPFFELTNVNLMFHEYETF